MKETRNYYTTPSNYTDHTTFGGVIYNYDFDGYSSISDIASRIIADKRFDEQCKQDAANRDRNKNYKKGTNWYGQST